VLMEAQLCGLAAVSTAISAIPELLVDGVNGKLVPQRNPDALADALQIVITDPALRDAMGRKGNEIVRRDFSFYRGMKDLAHRFGVSDPLAGDGSPNSDIHQPAAQ
ncbi:MAG: colanic acid biosynthesis glycosyltransferase WcaL, partial [Thalassospira sp.]